MYAVTYLLFLATSAAATAAVGAQRASSFNLINRDAAQGWSLQAGSTPSGTTSCGNGAYCPSSLHCNPAANHEVAACCTSSSDCRGDVEGAPKCADSSWNLWIGYDNNGFCCESGLVGAYDINKSVAGTCVASGDVGALRTAVLTSTGSGAAATGTVASSATVTSSFTSESFASSQVTYPATSSSTASATTGKTSTTSSKPPAVATGSGADKLSMGFGLVGAAVLVVAAL